MKKIIGGKHENRQTRIQRVLGMLRAADIVLEGHPDKEVLFNNFVEGIALAEYGTRTGNIISSNRIESLTKPVFDLILNYFRSDEYRQAIVEEEVSGDDVHEIDLRTSPKSNVKSPITTKKVLNHIKKKDVFILLPKDVRLVLQDMLNTNLERYASPGKIKAPPQSIKFEDLFRTPDNEVHAKLVKEVLNDMRLVINGRMVKDKTITLNPNTKLNVASDQQAIYKNTMAYVYCALLDSENNICIIKHGSAAKHIKVFFREFGMTVVDSAKDGYVTMRNLSKVLDNAKRRENGIYKEFSLRYKEKLKKRKLL